ADVVAGSCAPRTRSRPGTTRTSAHLSLYALHHLSRRFRQSLHAPGTLRLSSAFHIRDSGVQESLAWGARQAEVNALPDAVLVYLLGSRYCDTDRLATKAWALFGTIEPGWPRVHAILDYTHQRITFSYAHARADRTASEGHAERKGVCRDFAHLAIALCRCLNIPARYCTGYLGDIGVAPDLAPMDFSAWLEVFLDGAWHTADAR